MVLAERFWARRCRSKERSRGLRAARSMPGTMAQEWGVHPLCGPVEPAGNDN
jgi:hypothetical protein